MIKNKFVLGTMLVGVAGLFTACSDDNDSNPVLTQPTEFVLNNHIYGNSTVDLTRTEAIELNWSQPKFTQENAPINAVYEIQVSPTNSFTVSAAEAEADKDAELVADYAAVDKTSTACKVELSAADLDKALMKVAKWEDGAVPATQKAYIRIYAFVAEGDARLYPIASNVLELNVAPYYMELRDADPIMWYLVGGNIGDGEWSNKPGESSFPMFIQNGFAYDKATGAGEITYLNYFTTDGWKIQPADFNWDYGFMGDGANTAVYRNGSSTDNGNIWCDPAGYYLVTVNTGNNTCSIKKQDITPDKYNQICITGSFCDWSDVNMVPANKAGENHVWYYTLTVADDAVEQIKFKIPGSWDTNWGFGSEDGEINICGKGTSGGKNIGVAAGTWIIGFNDITGEFSIITKQ